MLTWETVFYGVGDVVAGVLDPPDEEPGNVLTCAINWVKSVFAVFRAVYSAWNMDMAAVSPLGLVELVVLVVLELFSPAW